MTGIGPVSVWRLCAQVDWDIQGSVQGPSFLSEIADKQTDGGFRKITTFDGYNTEHLQLLESIRPNRVPTISR